MARRSGRHFLQLPGPTNVPERITRAMGRPVIDHRGPEFARMTRELLEALGRVFGTSGPVFVYPSSGSGAWEAAMANTLAPGDRVLLFDHGHFARRWAQVGEGLGLEVDMRPGDWREPVSPVEVEAALRQDRERDIRALLIVHCETSTGVVTDVPAMRAALDRTDHPALLMVDVVSSVGSMEYRHDDWGVDVAVGGSQKGLMLPPGLAFNAVGSKALEAASGIAQGRSHLPNSYWRWDEMLDFNRRGIFPYTPATTLLFGLAEAVAMLEEEGWGDVFARHRRHAEATHRAVEAWGLERVCRDPAAASPSVTAVFTPEGHDADALRAIILDRFDMSLGKGLGELEGRAFRIGHLGDFNDLMLAGTLAGVEMGMAVAGVPHQSGGLQAALDLLAGRESLIAEGVG